MRLWDADQSVLGAGVLLGNRHVLTCTHVVQDAANEVLVDPVGMPESTPVSARTKKCVPMLDDQRGDVALLELKRPQRNGFGVTLHRRALSWNRPVHTLGFPGDGTLAIRARMTLVGEAGPGEEWIQMVPYSSTEYRVHRGFSGAGVVDQPTGEVIGIVVATYAHDGGDASFMIPVETILSYLPEVAQWVTGDSAADEVFSEPVEPGVEKADVARSLAAWLRQRGVGDPVMILVGADRAVLRRAVALSSRERRPAASEAPDGTVPALGSIDVAVDASGKTADQISQRIVARAGIPVGGATRPSERVRAGVPPMTVVVDNVDEAAQPATLLHEVLKPLASGDVRLVLGFASEASTSLQLARSWDLGSVDARLAKLAERISALAAAEDSVLAQRAKVVGPEYAEQATRLRMRLSGLRMAAQDPQYDPQWTRRKLEKYERAVINASRAAEDATLQLDELVAERDELRGLLDASRAQAADRGLVENVDIDAIFRTAHELLSRSPTDVAAARQAVREYRSAVRRSEGRSGR